MATELVIDSTAAIRATGSSIARAALTPYRLIAPPLLWSEVTSAMSEAVWRKQLTRDAADGLLRVFDGMQISRLRPAGLYKAAWTIARELGWAKTYDAEFLALARLRGCQTVTTDERLLRGGARTGLVLSVGALAVPT